jgi:hypothetical protein
MEAQCQPGGGQSDTDAIPFDEAGCRDACNSFAEDPAYADAVAERVSCLEEQLDEGFGCSACTIDGT